MGNAIANLNTNLNIDEYIKNFKEDFPNRNEYFEKPWGFTIIVETKKDFEKRKGYGNCFRLRYIDDVKNPPDINITLKPDSHMRDFEIVGKERVARGRGICVIFIQKSQYYIKLIFDKESDFGYKCVSFGRPKDVNEFKMTINQDLGMGYSFFYIDKNNEPIHLCEKRDKRDEDEVDIYFKSLKKLKRYDDTVSKKKLKLDDESDSSDTESVSQSSEDDSSDTLSLSHSGEDE